MLPILCSAQVASRRKCSGFLAVIAATTLATLCPRPADAQEGTWDFSNDVFQSDSKQVNGVTQSYSGGDKALRELNQENLEDYYTVGPTTNYPAFGYVRVPVSQGSANGSILLKGRDRIIAYWTPPSSGSSGAPGGSPPPPGGSPPPPGATATPAPTPPATVTVLVNATTTASFGDGLVAQVAPDAVLDNGFGDPTRVISDPNDPTSKHWASQGLRLKTMSTKNRTWIPPTLPTQSNGYTSVPGKWKVELPFDFNLSASIMAIGTVSSASSAGTILAQLGGLTFSGDSRSYILSSSGFSGYSFFDGSGRNWRKDGDPTIGLYPTENKPQVIDTIAVPSPGSSGGDQYSGGGSFSVDARNFITPSYNLSHHWSWTGGAPDSAASSELATTGSHIHLPVSGPTGSTGLIWFGADPKSFPKRSTVKVTATDGDGIKAEDSIAITWHLPLENTETDYAIPDVSGIRYDIASPWVVLGMPVTVTYSSPSVWWSIAGGGTTVLAGGAAFLPPPASAIVGLALIGAGYDHHKRNSTN